MKKTLLLVLFSIINIGAQAQTWRGKVLDQGTKEPIPGVAVYLDGTSTYTITDAEGTFELSPKGYINSQLVFSHLSYRTFTVEKPFTDVPSTVYMEEKAMDMEEIVVEPVPFSRRELLRFFRENFLGDTRAGRSCEIENEDDIKFGFSTLQRKLWAYSDVPLRIRNRYLGYEILFNLMEFQVSLGSVTLLTTNGNITMYYGTSSYNDLAPGNSRYQQRRNEVYEQSMTAFFRELAYESLAGSDFLVFKEKMPLSFVAMPITVTDAGTVKKITIQANPEQVQLNRSYKTDVFLTLGLGNRKDIDAGTSTVYFLSDEYLVDPYGNIDKVMEVLTMGSLGGSRVGEMLPLDFVVE